MSSELISHNLLGGFHPSLNHPVKVVRRSLAATMARHALELRTATKALCRIEAKNVRGSFSLLST